MRQEYEQYLNEIKTILDDIIRRLDRIMKMLGVESEV